MIACRESNLKAARFPATGLPRL